MSSPLVSSMPCRFGEIYLHASAESFDLHNCFDFVAFHLRAFVAGSATSLDTEWLRFGAADSFTCCRVSRCHSLLSRATRFGAAIFRGHLFVVRRRSRAL